MMDKILHVSHSLETGGGPLYVKKIIDDVVGFQYYVAGNQGYFFDVLKKQLGEKKVVALAGKNLFRNVSIILKLCKAENITVIHCHGRGAGLYARLIKLFKPHIRIIYTVHGFHPETVNARFRYFYILLEKIFFRLTDYIVHVSLSEKERFIKHIQPRDASKCLFIPNYISSGSIEQKPFPMVLDTDLVNIIYIGRLGHEKGIDILIDAIALLRPAKTKFYLIGYGPSEDLVKEKIRVNNLGERAVLLGKHDGAASFLKHFDAIVIPSRFEGMPFICLEAMISKIAIVATPAVGTTDLISTATAYIAENFAPESLSHSIAQFLSDKKSSPDKISLMIEKNYNTVLEEYSPDNANKIKALYLTS